MGDMSFASVPERPGDTSPTLEGLLHRCARGDEAAFARLYDLTSARMYGLALRVVRNPTYAEEVTQEAYLETWRTSARFDASRGAAISWLMTITHRRAVDRVRSVAASTRRDETFESRTHVPAYDTTVEEAHRSLDAERVRRALGHLTDTQRQAVELAYFGGYTHVEVAQLLDLPLGTAKTRIRDGLIRLRDTMGVER
ncbi:ECF RNA polymerase sigma factor SigK [Calidifontibacter terrae]